MKDSMDDKIFFMPGDLVTLKQDLPGKPVMIVIKKITNIIKQDNLNVLKGIKCRWFTSDGLLQEAIWNTKDLIKYEGTNDDCYDGYCRAENRY